MIEDYPRKIDLLFFESEKLIFTLEQRAEISEGRNPFQFRDASFLSAETAIERIKNARAYHEIFGPLGPPMQNASDDTHH